MDFPPSSSKGRRQRERSRERSERQRPPRSAGRVNPRYPRTVTSTEVDDYDRLRGDQDDFVDSRNEGAEFGADNREREDNPRPPQSPPKKWDKGSRGKPQPYFDDRRGSADSQPHGRRRNPNEVGETSSTYNKSYDTGRPTSRYPPERRRDRQEERGREPEDWGDTESVTTGIGHLRIQDEGHYTLNPTVAPPSAQYASSQTEASSYSIRQYDATQPAVSTTYYSPRERDSIPITAEADHFRLTQPHSISDYHSTRAIAPTTIIPEYHPEPFDPIQTDYTTAVCYPAQHDLPPSQLSYAVPTTLTYYPPQRSVAVVDARQQANPAARRNQEAQQRLDASFTVRNHDYMKFFRVGKVFMTLWHGPLGSSANEHGSLVSEVVFGEKVYSKVRRFIVVRQDADRRSATCLPITSYGGNGQGKSGIKREEHGFIYSKREPRKVSGMCSKALKVILSPNCQHLTDPSLVHYGKVHTVEGNWKVKDIGNLDDESIKTLSHYWRKIFGFVKDDQPEPGMTPRAKEVDLAHVGAVVDSFPAALGHGSHLPAMPAQQHFASTSPPAGYPPTTTRESSGGDRGSNEYYSTQPTYFGSSRGAYEHPSTHGASSYGTTSYHTSAPYYGGEHAPYLGTAPAQGTASYQGYSVAIAPGRAVSSTVPYPSQGPSTTDYYEQQYTVTNPQAAGGTSYEKYPPPHQVQQSWAPVGPSTNPRYADTYRHSTTSSVSHATPYQDPSGQWAEPASGSTYAKPSEYNDSAIAPAGADADIVLPTLEDARQARERRDSRGGGSSHHKRRNDRRK